MLHRGSVRSWPYYYGYEAWYARTAKSTVIIKYPQPTSFAFSSNILIAAKKKNKAMAAQKAVGRGPQIPVGVIFILSPFLKNNDVLLGIFYAPGFYFFMVSTKQNLGYMPGIIHLWSSVLGIFEIAGLFVGFLE